MHGGNGMKMCLLAVDFLLYYLMFGVLFGVLGWEPEMAR